MITLTIELYYYFYQLKWINLIILNFIFENNIIFQSLYNVVWMLVLWSAHNFQAMLWCCLNVVLWLNFNVGHQLSDNIAWALCKHCDIILFSTLYQCCDNIVKLRIFAVLWQCCHKVIPTLWQHCSNVVIKRSSSILWQHCRNILYPKWPNSTLSQRCLNVGC